MLLSMQISGVLPKIPINTFTGSDGELCVCLFLHLWQVYMYKVYKSDYHTLSLLHEECLEVC